MTAQVLQEACIQCGLCPSICPAVFTLPGNGGSARAVEGEIPLEQQIAAQEAAQSCPVSAIVIR
ncbi:MAG: ferredoxin [Oscillospiraceae bacterium]|nr:ferredoxin [Oscillospiraceae bacterium]